jgi:hypothetical protein
MMTRTALAAAAACISVAGTGSAGAADYRARERVVIEHQLVPQCFDSKVFDTIAKAFEQKERQYWNSSLVLLAFGDARELAYRPWSASHIPRRFCEAQTRTSDGTQRSVFYSIGYGTGTLGVSWGVEWCVNGLDRNLSYAPGCRMAQP